MKIGSIRAIGTSGYQRTRARPPRRLMLLPALLLFGSCIASADTWIHDEFNEKQKNCNYSMNAPYSACDVIGDPDKYDIEKAQVAVTSTNTKVDLYFNYPNAALQPFNDGLTLGVGDLFFFKPGSTYAYGVAMQSHGSFKQGDLYQIGGPVGTVTADQVLHNGNYFYRRNETVLLSGSGPALADGAVSVSNNGNGNKAAKFLVSVQFTNPSNFFNDIVDSNNEVGISFASAWCGNDFIRGTATATPEPAAFVVLAAGLAWIAHVRSRRKIA